MDSHSFIILEEKIKQTLDHLESLMEENETLKSQISSLESEVGDSQPGMTDEQRDRIREKVNQMLDILESV